MFRSCLDRWTLQILSGFRCSIRCHAQTWRSHQRDVTSKRCYFHLTISWTSENVFSQVGGDKSSVQLNYISNTTRVWEMSRHHRRPLSPYVFMLETPHRSISRPLGYERVYLPLCKMAVAFCFCTVSSAVGGGGAAHGLSIPCHPDIYKTAFCIHLV